MQYNREIINAKTRYERGLEQLDDTQKQVVMMQDMLKLLQPQLITATQDVERMLLEVEKESHDVEEFEKIVKIDEAAAAVSKIHIYLTITMIYLKTVIFQLLFRLYFLLLKYCRY